MDNMFQSQFLENFGKFFTAAHNAEDVMWIHSLRKLMAVSSTALSHVYLPKNLSCREPLDLRCMHKLRRVGEQVSNCMTKDLSG